MGVMLRLSKHSGQALLRVLRQAQDDSALKPIAK